MSGSQDVSVFQVLDLPVESSPEQVRKRCQQLLLKLHPDKNGGTETPEFHKVYDL
jgi:curved DNA-binding protein CbpA